MREVSAKDLSDDALAAIRPQQRLDGDLVSGTRFGHVGARGFEARGGLAPSQAYDPKEFLRGLDRFDVRWQVEGVEQLIPVEG